MPDGANSYADIDRAGGLVRALEMEMVGLGSTLRATPVDGVPFVYARFERGSRFVQCYTAARERLFLIEYWDKGVALANSNHRELRVAATAISRWIVDGYKLQVMRQETPDFRVDEQAQAFEDGRGVEARWRKMLPPNSWGIPETQPLIEAAARQPALRQLFPFTSLHMLCFSRTTGYPYTIDCPYAEPVGKGRYRAKVRDGRILGEGDAEEVIALVVKHLPPSCGPAVDGTAEDRDSRSPGAQPLS